MLVAASTALLFVNLFPMAGAQAPGAVSLPPVESFSAGPLRFIENRGQHPDASVRFITNRAGLETLLLDDGFVTRFVRVEGQPDPDGSERMLRKPILTPLPARSAALKFTFGTAVSVTGASQGGGKVNYLIGNDRSRWVRGASSFREVRYAEIARGVGARFHEQNGSVKYDIEFAAGVSTGAFAMMCEGAESMSIDATGALVITTPVGSFRHSAPVAFEIDAAGGKHPVAAEFVITGNATTAFSIAFSVPLRNLTNKLCIDPGLTYGTFVGGSGVDSVQDIAVDGAGNAYVTGFSNSTNLPIKPGVTFDQSNGNFDAFVMKIKPDGSDFIYTTYLGGVALDQATGIAIDNTGAAYVCGSTLSINFPTSATAADKTWSFGTVLGDAFITKLMPDGSDIIASTYLGGAGDEIALKIGIDTQLNVYVTGWTRSGTLDFPTNNGFQTTFGGTQNNDLGDAFLTRYNSTLSGVIYSTYAGGIGSDAASGLAVNAASGVATICGLARNGFPSGGLAGSTALNPNIAGNGDGFIVQIDTTKSGAQSFVFGGFLGGTQVDTALDVALDAGNNIYVTGYTESPNFPTKAGSFDTTYNSTNGKAGDAWVAKLNSTGKQFAYSGFLGGLSTDAGTSIGVDNAGAAYVCGRTTSTNFPKVAGVLDSTYNGKLDGFIIKLNPAGTAIAMASYIGGTNDDNAIALAVRTANDVFVCGQTLSTFLQNGAGFDTVISGQDGFVLRLDLGPVAVICLDDESPIIVSHPFGSAATTLVNRVVENCGTIESVLDWDVIENPAAPWLTQSVTTGLIPADAPGDTVGLTFDPAGLALGAYKTNLEFINAIDTTDKVIVPVTYVVENATITPFVAGSVLSGTIAFEAESDIGSFAALKGQKLQMGVSTTAGNLKPVVQVLDENGTVLKTFVFSNSTKVSNRVFTFSSDGNFRIRVSGNTTTTGDFLMTTKATYPKDGKASKKNNAAPLVNGGPVDYKVRVIAGGTLSATATPSKTITNPMVISLLDPDGMSVDVAAFTQNFGTNGGRQIVDVPATKTGQYTIRVTGPAVKTERVNITATPVQPAGNGTVVLP